MCKEGEDAGLGCHSTRQAACALCLRDVCQRFQGMPWRCRRGHQGSKPAFQGSRQGVETLRKDKEMRTAAWNGINTLQSLHHHNIVSVLAVVVVPLTKMPALVMRWYPHTRTSTHHTVGGGHRQDQGAVGGRRAASASMAAPLDSTAQAHTHSKHWAAAAPHQGPIPTRT